MSFKRVRNLAIIASAISFLGHNFINISAINNTDNAPMTVESGLNTNETEVLKSLNTSDKGTLSVNKVYQEVDSFKLVLVKTDKDGLTEWSTNLNINPTHSFEDVFEVGKKGFVAITKFNTNSYSSTNKHKEGLNAFSGKDSLYEVFAFNTKGSLMLSEQSGNIDSTFLTKFISNAFNINSSDSDENKEPPIEDSQEDKKEEEEQKQIVKKAQELLSVAEKTLKKEDILKAGEAIFKVKDESLKLELITKLNEISKKSIEKELEQLNTKEKSSEEKSAYIGKSYLNLSVDTNSIEFTGVNHSEDSILEKAVNIEVSSLLPYDINVSIENDIKSLNSNTVLPKSVFSIKESSNPVYSTFDDLGEINVVSNAPAGDFKTHSLDLKLNSSSHSIKENYRAVFKVEVITK